MNTCIKSVTDWLKGHPKVAQWAWFITLWLGGLSAVFVMTYPIKWIIKNM